MPKYKKLSVIIEAHILTETSLWEICRWMNSKCSWDDNNKSRIELIIPTLEGDMIAKEGDYIIKGIKGEFYPCRKDIFESSYEKVED